MSGRPIAVFSARAPTTKLNLRPLLQKARDAC